MRLILAFVMVKVKNLCDVNLQADVLLLLQISSGVVWQTRDHHLSHNTLDLLSPRLCFFFVLKRDLFVYRGDSSTS